jgi:hypothetical protein
MKKLFVLLSIFAISFLSLQVRANEPANDDLNQVISYYLQKVNADSIESYMQTLEDFGTRFCLASNRKEVAQWIQNKFISLGYPDTRLDSFPFNRWYGGNYYQTWQYNVVATYEGYLNPDQYYVMGGHYDAIVPSSSNPFVIAPGADDNASGVAAAIEVARIMKQYDYIPESSIKFMAFAAEELGLHGAWHYANNAANQNMDIVFMLNNDMISYCTLPQSQWTLRIQKYPNSLWVTNLATYIAQVFTELSVTESTQYIQYSDSWPFYHNGYHAIFLQENQFTPFYHTVNDLVIHSNMPYTAEMVKVSLGMLIHENGLGTIAGSNCGNPELVSLPIIDLEGSTEDYGNHISPEWLIADPWYASNYVAGNDRIFEFTLSENSVLDGSVICPEGNNAGLFILGDCPGADNPTHVLMLAAGTSGGSFQQLPLPAGTYYAIVSTWPDPEFTTFSLNLSAVPASQQAEIAITPDEMHFGIVGTGQQSVPQEFIIRNIGNQPLGITDISLTGEDASQFLITNQAGTLPLELHFGESTTVAVVFEPTQAGLQTAFFTVTDHLSAVHHVVLTGNGYDGPVISPPYAQDFSGTGIGQIPEGWTQVQDKWSTVNSNYAGGDAPELKFAGTSAQVDSYKLITNPINATNTTGLEISFLHMLDGIAANQDIFTLKLQASTNGGITWQDLWLTSSTSGIPSETVSLDLGFLDGEILLLAWEFEGAPANINAWYLDNIVLSGETSPFLAGDANCDEVVDVLDVVASINFVLGNNPSPFCFENADVNQDGIVNVLDVVGTVNIITGTGKSSRIAMNSGTAYLSLYPGQINLKSDGTLAGLQFTINGKNLEYMNLNFELNGYEFAYAVNDQQLTGIIFSFDNKPIPSGDITLFTYEGNQRELHWGGVVAANLNAEEVPVEKRIENFVASIHADEYKLLTYPNPARGDFTVEVDVPFESVVVLRILDMVGKEVFKIHEGFLHQGTHQYMISSPPAITAGFYLLHISAIPEGAAEKVINKNIKLIMQ